MSYPQPGQPQPVQTKQCPYCAETIQAQAVVCRFCSRDLSQPQQRQPFPQAQRRQSAPPPAPKKKGCLRRILVWGGIGLLVLIILVVAFGGGSDSPSTVDAVPTFTPTPDGPTATPIPPTPLPAVGVDVMVDNIRWKILSAEKKGNLITDDNQFTDDLQTSGQFIQVRFEIENMNDDSVNYSGTEITDSKDRNFERREDMDTITHLPDDEYCGFEQINPYIVKTCSALYEVPTDAVDLKFEATGLETFGSTEYISLGF